MIHGAGGRKWIMAWGVVALALTGCRTGTPPSSAAEALQRINGNLSRIDRTLRASTRVSARFRDADGKERRFIGAEARVMYRAPRCLALDIQSLSGVVAQFASNDERYWLWTEPDGPKLWWGTWADLTRATGRDIPVPPDELLDALMLRPLPDVGRDGQPPTLRVQGREYWLVYGRGAAGAREVRVDDKEPYQALEIVDRDSAGRVTMRATLAEYPWHPYIRVGRDGPFIPAHYVVVWPLDKSEVRMDVSAARFRDDLADYCPPFPEGFQGEVQRINQPDSAAPPARPRAQ